MTVSDIAEKLDLEFVVTADPDREVNGCYIGDLLSNVMARAAADDLWLTIQGHQNVIAIALLVDIAAVILVEDFSMDDKALKKAEEKGINVLSTDASAYEIAGKLYEEGV
ncbi:MAG: DRTGG domain-containing protein [Halanaerobiaceae bacterium]